MLNPHYRAMRRYGDTRRRCENWMGLSHWSEESRSHPEMPKNSLYTQRASRGAPAAPATGPNPLALIFRRRVNEPIMDTRGLPWSRAPLRDHLLQQPDCSLEVIRRTRAQRGVRVSSPQSVEHHLDGTHSHQHRPLVRVHLAPPTGTGSRPSTAALSAALCIWTM